MTMKQFRLIGWGMIAFFLFIGVLMVSPQNVPVMAYKLTLVTIAGVLAYYFDRALFPYARPHELMKRIISDQFTAGGLVLCAAMLRRAIIVAAFVMGVSTGL